MQVYTWTRGIKDRVDAFINDMQAQWFKYVDDPNSPYNHLQFAVRPIQLWELAFPKEHLNAVLGMIGYIGHPGNRPELKYPMWAMRKMLKAKELPVLDMKKILRPRVRREFVATYPIGYREDQIIGADEPRAKQSPELIGKESI